MGFKYNTRIETSANKAILGRESEMVKNDGGGVSFKISDMEHLNRFLITGAESGTAYLSKEQNQYNNLINVINCIRYNGVAVVKRIAEVSSSGLAHKNDHAIFALSLVFTHGDNSAKQEAVSSFDKVIRTGTHMFMFCEFIKGSRGFGKLVREAISKWYTERSDISFATQLTKYQNRNGWTHKDVFRLAHPNFEKTPRKNDISKLVFKKEVPSADDEAGKLLEGIKKIRDAKSDLSAAKIVTEYGLQREHIPSEFLNSKNVQAAYLPNLGGTALLRNLGNMSKSGLLTPNSDASIYVINKLTSKDFIKSNRLHPLTILVAERTYKNGRGQLGNSTWSVNQQIASALSNAFYMSFDLIEPTNKRYVYGIDVSGSMTCVYPGTFLTYHEIATVLALAHAKTEKYTFIGGFSNNYIDLGISSIDTFDSALAKTQKSNFGSTNPSAMFTYCLNNNINADCFIAITDNDYNSGSQPSISLSNYRKKTGINSKLVCCGLVPSQATMCDPKDMNSMNISGFSPDITSLINNFVSMR